MSDSGNRRYKQVLSARWECSNFVSGHVKGGMSYNRNSGFLRIPVAGTYFVYSQVLMWTNSSGPVQYGHSTVTCSCTGDCSCHAVANVAGVGELSTYRSGREYLTSFSSGTSGGTNYHGGLFHLDDNSYFAVVSHYRDVGDIAHSAKAFMGAYLVSPDTPAACFATPSNATDY